MSSGKKIANVIADRRSQIPLLMWIKSKLFAVYRQDITPPPGLPTADGKCVFHDPNRYADEMSARDQPPPHLPGGVNHRIYDNDYFKRDARRAVRPPFYIYDVKSNNPEFKAVDGKTMSVNEVKSLNKGPESNFGLVSPTPGAGIEWKRTISEELDTQQRSADLRYAENFDRFATSG
uniref:NADH dehydrogenase [ubiquinone] 1 alpha subcomplex subunit 7 n=1 Tax=Syphacia muris TaxID=451379 RepID=A0A0N5ANE8_9BILA